MLLLDAGLARHAVVRVRLVGVFAGRLPALEALEAQPIYRRYLLMLLGGDPELNVYTHTRYELRDPDDDPDDPEPREHRWERYGEFWLPEDREVLREVLVVPVSSTRSP